MGWTAPRTYTIGEIITKAILDVHVKDNLIYLKGTAGIPTIESGLIIDNTGGDEYLLLPLLSTAECATVLNVAGEVAYDEATNRIKFYGAALNSLVSTADVDDTPVDAAATDPISSNWAYDHVAAADPHTGYQKESEKDAANGYCGLDAGGLVVLTDFPALTSGKVWQGDGTNRPAETTPVSATKEFFVPVTDLRTTGAVGDKGDFGVIVMTAGNSLRLPFKCPHDFTSLTHCKVIGIKGTTGTIDWTVTTDFALIGEAYTTNSDTDTANGLAMTGNEIEEVDISAAFTGLAADDYVGVNFVLDAISAGQYNVIGIVFKYA